MAFRSSKTEAKVEEVLEAPTLFGPSSLERNRTAGGWTYVMRLWVGGRGLAIDGHWGRTLQYQCTIPFEDPIDPCILVWKLTSLYESDLRKVFSTEASDVIIYLLGKIAAGDNLIRPFRMEEILELYTCAQ